MIALCFFFFLSCVLCFLYVFIFHPLEIVHFKSSHPGYIQSSVRRISWPYNAFASFFFAMHLPLMWVLPISLSIGLVRKSKILYLCRIGTLRRFEAIVGRLIAIYQWHVLVVLYPISLSRLIQLSDMVNHCSFGDTTTGVSPLRCVAQNCDNIVSEHLIKCKIYSVLCPPLKYWPKTFINTFKQPIRAVTRAPSALSPL